MALTQKKSDDEKDKAKETFNIKEYLQLLWVHKYWIVLSVLICVGVAMYKAYRTPHIYGSQAQMMILNSFSRGTAGNSTMLDFGDLRGMGGDINIANEMEVLKSPALMEQVVAKLDLNTEYTTPGFGYDIDLYGICPITVHFLDVPNDSTASVTFSKVNAETVKAYDFVNNGKSCGSKTMDIPLGQPVETPIGKVMVGATVHYPEFQAPITVHRNTLDATAKDLSSAVVTMNDPTQNSVITISTSNRSQQKAVDIVNTLMEVYNEAWIQEKNKSAINTSNFIKERLAVIEKELSGIDEDISEVKSNASMPDFNAAAGQYMSQYAQYDNRAFELATQISIANFLLEYIHDPKKENEMIPANSGLNTGSIENQIQEYNRMLMRRDNLRANSSDAHPEIKELNSNLTTMRQMITRSLENLISTLQVEANRNAGRGDMFAGRASTVPEQEKQILSIERQQKVKENLYLYLLQKREENELTGMITVNNTKILKAASPSGPVSPVKSRMVLIGFLIGLVIPCVIIYIVNLLNTKIRSKEDFEDLGIPFIGEVPIASRSRSKKKKKFSMHKLLHPSTRRLDDDNLEIVIKERSRSSVNEAFRMIRTNLDFMLPSDSDSKTIMITSFNPGSGKTFISLNLSTSLALKNKRVVAIDLDLRRASLSKYIGSPSQGISTFLMGKTGNVMDLVVRRPERSLIDILPAGAIPPNPAELLLSNKLETMMEQLKQNYDYIIIDCPPHNIVADTSIIARVADMTIFVARSGMMEKSMLKTLKETYDDNILPHMAIILNGISSSRGAYMYRYGYGYKGSRNYYIEDDDKGADMRGEDDKE